MSWGEPRVGFFTDTSICIGCKACEVACKEWNQIPDSNQGFTGHSYDNTLDLGANTWRHVAFVEQRKPVGVDAAADSLVEAAMLNEIAEREGVATYQEGGGMRWLMASDVCKHCTDAACLEACPTGALFRTEFGTVVVQEDVCNGCGYCVAACPFVVIDQPEDDLDNRYIYDEVVRVLSQVCEGRQVIVATHNANIPVLGDAELVLALDADADRSRVLACGGLEEPEVADQARQILEGGDQAFLARHRRYLAAERARRPD